jgi:hypothetical protein
MLNSVQLIGPTIVGVMSALVAVVSVLVVYRSNIRQLQERQREEERQEIYKKLNSFYGPILQLRSESSDLYELFTVGRDKNFRTLWALLDGETFVGNDAVLLQQIFDVTKKTQELIYSNAGLVDNQELQGDLAELCSHFRILRLAKRGRLKKE